MQTGLRILYTQFHSYFFHVLPFGNVALERMRLVPILTECHATHRTLYFGLTMCLCPHITFIKIAYVLLGPSAYL
jgi:hypothetical protein